ncbi:hypothetical protein CDAR_32931 [Caerostris darwini]|uniref:Uncharacterized protein n=1 Tax=Caerostris darwini TaxID=1538125 RepID=A0AAV4SMK4_9ARAC|nr:hypothetical protein CDAR_32931 [Caerostris darwini]
MRLSTHSIESETRGTEPEPDHAALMRVARRGALGPDADGRGYYFTLETALEGSGVETLGTSTEEKANFPTSSLPGIPCNHQATLPSISFGFSVSLAGNSIILRP